jgi:hypothetical protein
MPESADHAINCNLLRYELQAGQFFVSGPPLLVVPAFDDPRSCWCSVCFELPRCRNWFHTVRGALASAIRDAEAVTLLRAAALKERETATSRSQTRRLAKE